MGRPHAIPLPLAQHGPVGHGRAPGSSSLGWMACRLLADATAASVAASRAVALGGCVLGLAGPRIQSVHALLLADLPAIDHLCRLGSVHGWRPAKPNHPRQSLWWTATPLASLGAAACAARTARHLWLGMGVYPDLHAPALTRRRQCVDQCQSARRSANYLRAVGRCAAGRRQRRGDRDRSIRG